MTLSKFIKWIDHYSEKISLFHVILLSCLFALISVVKHHGGILYPEMELRLPFYLSDMPLLNKLFDSMILDMDFYRARELSYFLDFIDSKFIEFSIANGFPHFLSLTHYLFSIATGCLLWLFCVKELNLKPLIGIGLLVLFWTSPSIFLGGVLFRTGKIGVALLVAILFYVIYKVAIISKKGIHFQISKKYWFLYFIAIFTITFFDEQGLFFAITVLIFLTIWGLVVRNKNIYIMLIIGVMSLLFHVLYRYTIAPQLTFMLNGYWPNFNYQTVPMQYFIQNLVSYLSAGFFLYVETFRFLIGNPPRITGIGILLSFILFPVFYLYTNAGLSANDRKFFKLALVELLITNVLLVIAMNALMILRHPPLILNPGIILTYYWLPVNVMLAMTLAILTDIFLKSRIPKWLALMVVCFAIIGNIVALPKDKAIIGQEDLQLYEQPCSALLNALKNLDSLNDIHEPFIEENPVFQFFKSKKNNNVGRYSANVYHARGYFYTARGQYQRAIENYSEAIRIKPDYAQAYYNRGVTYAAIGQHQHAVEDYDKAIRIRPNSAADYTSRGMVYNNLGQYQRAIEDYNKAIYLKPFYALTYNNRGNVYTNLGQYRRAIEDYNEAIRTKPAFAEAYHNRGVAYNNLGQYQRAIEDYNKAIHIAPHDSVDYIYRGDAQAALGQYQHALNDYSEAIRLKSDYADAYNNRGGAYFKLGKYQRAIEDFNEAIRLKSDYADAYNNRAIVYLMQRDKKTGCSDAHKSCALGNCHLLGWAKNKGYCR
jgi:tetratricopeptide (TPR) repeat protein